MSEALAQSIADSVLDICGVQLRVHVLDDGQRVIEEEGLMQLFLAWEAGTQATEGEVNALAQFVKGSHR